MIGDPATCTKPGAALLAASGDGSVRGAIQHAATYQLVSPDAPAVAGEAIIIYCTGLIDQGAVPPLVSIGGRAAEVLWFGRTPGYAILDQVNVRVPNDVAPGPAIPVSMTYLDRTTNEVTIAVQ